MASIQTGKAQRSQSKTHPSLTIAIECQMDMGCFCYNYMVCPMEPTNGCLEAKTGGPSSRSFPRGLLILY